MHHRPSILLCDMGDTLIRWTGYDRERGLRSLREYCDHPERFDLATLVERGIALDHELEERADASLLEFREADFLHAIFGTIGIILRGSDDEVEARYWSEALTFDPEPGVASALERISAAGVRLGVISNTIFGPGVIEHELTRQDLLRFFERPLLTSARYGTRKPHPLLFEVALGLFGVTREESWYIGNSRYHDVGGATAAGLTAVWYNTGGLAAGMPDEAAHPDAAAAPDAEPAPGAEPERSPAPVPIHEVASWAACAELIETLS